MSFAQGGPASTLAAEIRAVSRKLKLRLREYGGRNDLTQSQVGVGLRLGKQGWGPGFRLARAEGMRPPPHSPIV